MMEYGLSQVTLENISLKIELCESACPSVKWSEIMKFYLAQYGFGELRDPVDWRSLPKGKWLRVVYLVDELDPVIRWMLPEDPDAQRYLGGIFHDHLERGEGHAMIHNRVYLLYVVLLVLTVAALVGLIVLHVFVFNYADRASFSKEIGKGLIQIFTVAIIGSIVKLLVDDHQRCLRAKDEVRAQAQKREQCLQEFRIDKIRRLVSVTNILRRAPVLIDAHRSAKTYNEQMREVVDAGLELRLIRHETDAIGRDPNPAFPEWPIISDEIRKMEKYVTWVINEFRGQSKELSELQRKTESNRKLQPKVWKQIVAIPSVRDLLHEVDAPDQKTRYTRDYLQYYITNCFLE